MSPHARGRMAALAAGVVAASLVTLVLTRGETQVVRADPPEPHAYGYFDQVNENTFYVELREGPFQGMFTVVIPAVGVFWSGEPLTVTEELDGSFSLSFDGEGFLDSEATIETQAVPRFVTSGDTDPVEFELSGSLSEDLSEIELDFEYDSQIYDVDSEPAPQTADDIVDDTIDAFEAENWSALRSLFVDALTDEFDTTEFAAMITSTLGPFGDLDSVEAVDSVVYQLNPSPGAQLATVTLEFTFLVGMNNQSHEAELTYLYRESSWQLLEIAAFEDIESLEFLTYPGTSVSGEAFLTQPAVSILTADRVVDEDDDTTAVTLAIGDGPSGAALACSGGLSRTAVDGVATFEACEVDKPGEYTLTATADNMATVETPSFRVVQLTGELVADGDSLTLTTLSGGASAWFAFEGNDEANFSLLIESESVAEADLYLRRQDSTNLVGGGGFGDGMAFLEFRNPGSLEDADYYLVVRGLNGDVGDFTASLVTFEDVSDEIAVDGQEHLLTTTGPGANARFDFEMAGDTSLVAVVTMSTTGVSGSVTLYTDDDMFVSNAEMVDSAATLFSTPLPAGEYYLIVDASGPAVGTIEVIPTVVADEIVVTTLDTPEEVELIAAGQNGRLRFTAMGGAMVAVDVEDSDFQGFNVRVVDANGNFLAGGYIDSAAGHIDAVELPASGTYEIWILPWSGETGTATVTAVDESP